MKAYEIKIEWEGPFTLKTIIKKLIDGGRKENKWEGEDYGIYQIYGKHILYEENILLYIGIATEQTFSERFIQHRAWLTKDQYEKDIKIYVGRVYNPQKHSMKDNRESWKKDIEVAEKILIYKYSPNYNSRELDKEPDLTPHKHVVLVHAGKRGKLKKRDSAPRDYA